MKGLLLATFLPLCASFVVKPSSVSPSSAGVKLFLHQQELRVRTSPTLQESPDTLRTQEHQAEIFQNLCDAIDVLPRDGVRLQTCENQDGVSVRGVYLRNREVKAGQVILSVPLSACLRDDEPPAWLDCDIVNHSPEDEPCEVAGYYNPSDWATRLAANVVEAQLDREYAVDVGTDLWLSLLPNPDFLRASLPIHWPSKILQCACSTALELAVDSAYFARAQAVQDVFDALNRYRGNEDGDDSYRRMVEDALDVVQTRSCRVILEDGNGSWSPPLRILAPVFDFINHPNKGYANADFGLEEENGEERLVVRALRDLGPDEEVLIDYGESARPAWKCLSSYGFVPTFSKQFEEDEQHVAEIYLHGKRFEVSPTQIPETMIEELVVDDDDKDDPDMVPPEVTLTPSLAMNLSQRISEVAYQLLLDPLDRYDEDVAETAEEVLAAQLAASLRFNQHRILLACSVGLCEWAKSTNGTLTA